MNTKLLSILLVLLITPLMIRAQAPQLFNFQKILRANYASELRYALKGRRT